MQKVVLALKKLILTSEQHAEHPFAGRNTQHWYVNQMVNLYSVFKWFQTQMPYLPFESRLMTI